MGGPGGVRRRPMGSVGPGGPALPPAAEVASRAPCEPIATHAAAWRGRAGVLRQSRRHRRRQRHRRRGAGTLGRRRREDGGRSQRGRQERGDLEDQEAHQEPGGGPRRDRMRPKHIPPRQTDVARNHRTGLDSGAGPEGSQATERHHRSNGTSMISLIIPPKDQISRVAKMLADEFGTASNIKSRVNRLSVLGAITSVQQRLKLYNKVPPNGLVVYCGTIVTEEGKEKKVNIDFEPFKPINTSLYLCDNKFHTEALTALLSDDSKFGFIVIDGSGALFGTLQGNTREVLHKFTVDLPKKHGRGGQSALRFARLRMEKRHNYVRKVAETAVQLFISGDKVNVAGLVLAGSADFKTELSQSDMFDQRLQSKVLKLVDISYGGENGFNQAIELSTEVLSNVKFIQEKKLIGRYFDEISQDTGKYCFGVEDTLKALEMGAVEILIVYENLDIMRYVLHCQGTEEEKILYLTPEQEKDKSHFTDKETGQEHELIESMPLLEWFANNYKKFGATLEIVTDKSQEGSQFVKGFGGIGGILRYRVDFQGMEYQGGDDEFFDLDDY
uniref:Eukaryotic peptide chain release factor subunit 1 n=3 Tax=Amniota TaxID=32524 RepID=A0A6I8NVV2_ORNAN